jgi:hypothetical protein
MNLTCYIQTNEGTNHQFSARYDHQPPFSNIFAYLEKFFPQLAQSITLWICSLPLIESSYIGNLFKFSKIRVLVSVQVYCMHINSLYVKRIERLRNHVFLLKQGVRPVFLEPVHEDFELSYFKISNFFSRLYRFDPSLPYMSFEFDTINKLVVCW